MSDTFEGVPTTRKKVFSGRTIWQNVQANLVEGDLPSYAEVVLLSSRGEQYACLDAGEARSLGTMLLEAAKAGEKAVVQAKKEREKDQREREVVADRIPRRLSVFERLFS